MFNTESQPTLQRIGRRLWRIGCRLYYPHTHTPIVDESGLESVLESADYSPKLADSNADSPKIGLWVWAFMQLQFCRTNSFAYIPPTRKLVPIGGSRWYRPPTQAFHVADTNMLASKKPHRPNTNPHVSLNANQWSMVWVGYTRFGGVNFI